MISQDQAAKRRAEIRSEADFFGSMDGASKFVRGDAVAGILILFVNILGGLLIGTLQHDLSLAEASHNYTLLTIGDGLVAQIPSILLSTGTAIIVTRMSDDQDMGEQVMYQLLSEPRTLAITSALLLSLGLIPGMPNFVFLALGASIGWLAWRVTKSSQNDESANVAAADATSTPTTNEELNWDDVDVTDPLGLEVGYRLIPMVDEDADAPLVGKIRSIRRALSKELGFLIQPVHIKTTLILHLINIACR